MRRMRADSSRSPVRVSHQQPRVSTERCYRTNPGRLRTWLSQASRPLPPGLAALSGTGRAQRTEHLSQRSSLSGALASRCLGKAFSLPVPCRVPLRCRHRTPGTAAALVLLWNVPPQRWGLLRRRGGEPGFPCSEGAPMRYWSEWVRPSSRRPGFPAPRPPGRPQVPTQVPASSPVSAVLDVSP